MLETNAIEVKNVSKDFRLGFSRKSFVKSIVENSKKDFRAIHALKDINFSVRRGEIFGITGPNASGKTTLLKVIAGILKTTKGEVEINGNLIALVELGLGFHDELTALENIYLYAAFLGMTKQEIQKKLKEITKFSEMGNFLDMKLKYYSTGMRSRLAFAVIVQVRTDIIVLDEFFAVGDIYFQEKCFETLEKFQKQGRTIILVTQSLSTIKRLCQRALLLDRGKQVMEGNAETVMKRYESLHNTDETNVSE